MDGFLKKLLTDVEDERTLDIGIPPAPPFFHEVAWKRQSWQVDFRYQIIDAIYNLYIYIYMYLFVFERDTHLEILAFVLEKLMFLRS